MFIFSTTAVQAICPNYATCVIRFVKFKINFSMQSVQYTLVREERVALGMQKEVVLEVEMMLYGYFLQLFNF